MKSQKVIQINLEDGREVTHTINYDQEFNITDQKVTLDSTGEEISESDPVMESIREFSAQFISPGDYYEDCRYRPILCYLNENGLLEGFDIVEGTEGWCCDEDNCGVVKLTMAEAYELENLWRTSGQQGVMESRGWSAKDAIEFIETWAPSKN